MCIKAEKINFSVSVQVCAIHKNIYPRGERPHLNFTHSLFYISCQIIDGVKGVMFATTVHLKDFESSSTITEFAKKTGAAIAKAALAAGITEVVIIDPRFDNTHDFKALAEAARDAGLKIFVRRLPNARK